MQKQADRQNAEASKVVANRKKEIEAKRQAKSLTEGAGAGYDFQGTITNIKINEWNIIREDEDKYGLGDWDLTCDITADLEDITCQSYYDEGKIPKTQIAITKLSLNATSDETDLYEDDIRDAIEGYVFESDMIGSGWAHQTFTGEAHGELPESGSYGGLGVYSIDIKFLDQDAINYLDLAVEGENKYTWYDVETSSGDFEQFDTEEEAIEYAKKNNCKEVEIEYSYYEFGGEEIGQPEWDVIWTNPDYDENLGESCRPSKKAKALKEARSHKEASEKVAPRKPYGNKDWIGAMSSDITVKRNRIRGDKQVEANRKKFDDSVDIKTIEGRGRTHRVYEDKPNKYSTEYKLRKDLINATDAQINKIKNLPTDEYDEKRIEDWKELKSRYSKKNRDLVKKARAKYPKKINEEIMPWEQDWDSDYVEEGTPEFRKVAKKYYADGGTEAIESILRETLNGEFYEYIVNTNHGQRSYKNVD